MNTFRILTIIIVAFAFIFVACETQSPFEAEGQSGLEYNPTAKFDAKPVPGYPMYDDQVFRCYGKKYTGGTLMLDNGSIFIVEKFSLTPPPGTPQGDKVKITWLAEFDETTGELTYTFGPSGCKFDPPAKVKLDYSKLNIGLDIPQLFLIDKDGNYLEEYPENVDIQNKKVTLYIDHFSRYALSPRP